jgi:CRISPR-associated DxTHG motif protein
VSRKIMTFLGTGKYEPCRYMLGAEPSALFRYVQLALAELLKPDQLIVFVTPSAYEKNYKGKKGLLASAAQSVAQLLKPVEIPEGKSPDEIWDIFKLVYKHVEGGDVISFVITHSFRSIPVMGLACLQYARTLRNVTIEGIYYGAFEARDPKTETAPIFDLTPFMQLMEWSQAVSEFAKFGQCSALHHQVWSGTSGRKGRPDNLLRTLAGDLEKTWSAIAGCRGKSIFLDPPWERIPGHLKKLRNQEDPLLTAFEPLLDLVEDKVACLRVEGVEASQEVRRGLGAVRWCLQNEMVQQAYSILQETMITHACRLSGLDYTVKEDRMLVSQSHAVSKKPRDKWEGEAKVRPGDVYRVIERVQPQLLQLLQDFSDWRHDVMHCKLKSDKEFRVLKDNVAKSFDRFMRNLEPSDA